MRDENDPGSSEVALPPGTRRRGRLPPQVLDEIRRRSPLSARSLSMGVAPREDR